MTTYIGESVRNIQSRSGVGHRARVRAHRGQVAAAVAFAVSFAIVSNVGAKSLACKPNVKVKNEKPKAVKVLKFGYMDNKGNDYTEGLANKKLSVNESETWKNQKLQHVAEGNLISKIRVKYRNDTSGESKPSDPWGSAIWTMWYTQTGDCTDSRTYSLNLGGN